MVKEWGGKTESRHRNPGGSEKGKVIKNSKGKKYRGEKKGPRVETHEGRRYRHKETQKKREGEETLKRKA